MITRANCVVLVLASLGACGTDRPSPRSLVEPEHKTAANENDAKLPPKVEETPHPIISTLGAPSDGGDPKQGTAALRCLEDNEHKCGPFSASLVSLCIKFSQTSDASLAACRSERWSRRFYESLLPHQEAVSSEKSLSSYYLSNYSRISSAVDAFYIGTFRCAAFASTALKLAGYPVTQKLVTNEVEAQLIGLGWPKITNMQALKAGDVVFTDKSTSNIAGTWSHMYIFHRYEGNDAIVSDNNGNSVRRNVGPGTKSKSVLAYRPPAP